MAGATMEPLADTAADLMLWWDRAPAVDQLGLCARLDLGLPAIQQHQALSWWLRLRPATMLLARASAIAAATRRRFAAVLTSMTGWRGPEDEEPSLNLAATALALSAFWEQAPAIDQSAVRARVDGHLPWLNQEQRPRRMPRFALPGGFLPVPAPALRYVAAAATVVNIAVAGYHMTTIGATEQNTVLAASAVSSDGAADEALFLTSIETLTEASDGVLADDRLSDHEALTLSRQWQELAPTEQSLESLIQGMSLQDLDGALAEITALQQQLEVLDDGTSEEIRPLLTSLSALAAAFHDAIQGEGAGADDSGVGGDGPVGPNGDGRPDAPANGAPALGGEGAPGPEGDGPRGPDGNGPPGPDGDGSPGPDATGPAAEDGASDNDGNRGANVGSDDDDGDDRDDDDGDGNGNAGGNGNDSDGGNGNADGNSGGNHGDDGDGNGNAGGNGNGNTGGDDNGNAGGNGNGNGDSGSSSDGDSGDDGDDRGDDDDGDDHGDDDDGDDHGDADDGDDRGDDAGGNGNGSDGGNDNGNAGENGNDSDGGNDNGNAGGNGNDSDGGHGNGNAGGNGNDSDGGNGNTGGGDDGNAGGNGNDSDGGNGNTGGGDDGNAGGNGNDSDGGHGNGNAGGNGDGHGNRGAHDDA